MLVVIGNSSADSILSRYLEDYQYIKTSLILNHFILIALILILLSLNHFATHRAAKIAIAVLASGLIVNVSYEQSLYLGGQKYFYTFTFIYILIIVIWVVAQVILSSVDWIRSKLENISVLVMAGLLLLMPLVGSFGTNNLLSIQIIWYTSFLFAGIYLLLYKSGPYLLTAFVIVLAINAAIQSISGVFYFPYRTNPISEESQLLLVGEERIKLNKELCASVKTAYDLVYSKTTFSPRDPIFAFASEYGYIYFLKGTLPGWGWYSETSKEMNRTQLESSRIKNIDQTIFILPVEYRLDSLYISSFKKRNVRFPEDYTKLGEFTHRLEAEQRQLAIYVPKKILKGK
ncbi:hypothetical protein WSM22_17330 [Cytophagales bacterium WSM2-2]|nr:hypothetical protein WSM22_17330 [Cytophagales bacterium WSM2-2]